MPQASTELMEYLRFHEIPWMFWDEEKGKVIMVIDNHLLSTYRACPQHFIHANVSGLARKSPVRVGGVERVWFLDFGILLHRMIELYYRDFRTPGFDPMQWATVNASELWNKFQMDIYSEHKEYKTIGGLYGFVGLLFQFAHVFTPENEKIRIIAQEVSFGKAGEVPLYSDEHIELYLSGRMDLVVDDGFFICPMDHKSMAYFKTDPLQMFLTDDGPTGYVYALSKILPKIVPEELILKRDCSKILMNLIGKKPNNNPLERFRRVPLRKTPYELEQYRLRMVKTAFRLFDDMEDLVVSNISPYRNTKMCDNWFHRQCAFFDICRQQSPDGEQATISNGYVQVKLWNTEEVQPIT